MVRSFEQLQEQIDTIIFRGEPRHLFRDVPKDGRGQARERGLVANALDMLEQPGVQRPVGIQKRPEEHALRDAHGHVEPGAPREPGEPRRGDGGGEQVPGFFAPVVDLGSRIRT